MKKIRSAGLQVTAVAICAALLAAPARCAAGTSSVSLTALIGTEGANSAEGFENLFDGNVETKWCVTAFDGAIAIWMYDTAVSATGYTITTANDNDIYNGRNPLSWTLFGCNADEESAADDIGDWEDWEWEALDFVEGDTILEDQNYSAYYYRISEELPAYQYYLLYVMENGGADAMQISEFALSYIADDGQDSVEESTLNEDAAVNISILDDLYPDEFSLSDESFAAENGMVYVYDCTGNAMDALNIFMDAMEDGYPEFSLSDEDVYDVGDTLLYVYWYDYSGPETVRSIYDDTDAGTEVLMVVTGEEETQMMFYSSWDISFGSDGNTSSVKNRAKQSQKQEKRGFLRY